MDALRREICGHGRGRHDPSRKIHFSIREKKKRMLGEAAHEFAQYNIRDGYHSPRAMIMHLFHSPVSIRLQ